MEVLVIIILVVTAAASLAGWRAPGMAQIVLALALVAGVGAAAALLGFRDSATPDGFNRATVVGVLGLLAVSGGGVLTTSVFRIIDGKRDTEEGSMRQAGEVLRGGAWIGGLERTAAFVSIVTAWPSGLAIILALKGLGRYAELRSETPGAAERFIIGTFASVLWAIACAGTAVLALG